MTKVRAPLSAHKALTTVAGKIGWDRAGEICRKAERTLRNWSEPDTSSNITVDHALELDRAYMESGGEGAPFAAWYHTQLQLAVGEIYSSAAGRLERAATAAKEAGEATAAQIRAQMPGASAADRAIAKRETEQAIAAFGQTLHDLEQGLPNNG